MQEPKKYWGQNFLTNVDVILDMISALDLKPEDRILEIGPGRGALTEYLIPNASLVLAIEIDSELYSSLKTDFEAYSNFKIINKNILDLDIEEVITKYNINKIIGSLPYNISKKIIEKFCADGKYGFETSVFMLQEEVAYAYLGSQYGKSSILSNILQLFNRITLVTKVDKYMFNPIPKVNSAVIKFKRKEGILISEDDIFNFIKFIHNCYRNPRKKLIKNLNSIYTAKAWNNIFKELNFAENIRVEQLSESELIKLFELFKLQKNAT